MVDQVSIHYLIPVIIARLLRFDKRLVLLLSPLAVLPDIDILSNVHRALTHNIFFGALMVFLSWLILKKWFKARDIVILSSFMFLAHIVIDGGHVILFYPLITYSYAFDFQALHFVKIHMMTGNFLPGYPLSFRIEQVLLTGLVFFALFYEAFQKWIHKAARRIFKTISQKF